MQRSFSIIDDDDDDDEVFVPEENSNDPVTKTKPFENDNNESDLSLSEVSSISPKRSENLQKLKDLELSPKSEETFFDDHNPSPEDSDTSRSHSARPFALSNTRKPHFFSDSDESEIENETKTGRSEYSDKASSSQVDVLNENKIELSVPPLLLVDSDDSEIFPCMTGNSPKIEKENFDEGRKDFDKVNDILSGRQTAVLRRRTLNEPKISQLLSDSDGSDNEDKAELPVPGEYNPKEYENLEVDDETKDLFQLISRYIPQQLNLTYKFKPFNPEFLPAVGDIDAFLKVYPPDTNVYDEKCTESFEHLGLTVLDEPASNQSDPAVLYLQLRAASGNPRKKNDENVVVKKIDNVEKNSKTIEKWIKDISDLHKSKSSVVMRYSEPMPDLDDLMQEWPEEVENELKLNGFPKPENTSLQEYIYTLCDMFQIPLAKKKVQSLYLLFCLYSAIKQTQLYKTSSSDHEKANAPLALSKNEADQLLLE